jgi:hypothetical protein
MNQNELLMGPTDHSRNGPAPRSAFTVAERHDCAARGTNGKPGRNRPRGADRMIAQHHSIG